MYDPLIVQLALASSAPLEGLGLDESDFLAAHGSSAAAIAAAGRELTQSGSFDKAAAGPGMLMLQPHPAASLAASTSLGAGAAEGFAAMSHLAAAEQALSQLDTKLQSQRTDSISLGVGCSAALGELDDVSLGATGAPAAAEAPAGRDGVDAGSGV
jgi:creatinine amidohydrolase/Fe(II)-dependent formamide hydrolase-like protein